MILGSMAVLALVVRGFGNAASLNFAASGAGRLMLRRQGLDVFFISSLRGTQGKPRFRQQEHPTGDHRTVGSRQTISPF